MTTLTKIIDAKFDELEKEGKTPDYKQVTEEVLASGVSRIARREAFVLGVSQRARYRQRALTGKRRDEHATA